MRASTTRLTILLALVAASACTCDGKDKTPGVKTAGRKLAPLPEPPKLALEPETLPGAESELAVVAARPLGKTDGSMHPTITFSRPVVALSSISEGQNIPPPAAITPKVEGEWRWVGSASVELVPRRPLPLSTRFVVTVAPAVALDGAKMKAPYEYAFETPAPELRDHAPEEGYRWATKDQVFGLTFDQPVKDVLAQVTLSAGEKALPLALLRTVDVPAEERKAARERGGTYWEDPSRPDRRTRYELQAKEPLPLGAELKLVVDGALPGQEGPLTLGQPKTITYRTYGALTVTRAQGCVFTWEQHPSCPYGPLVLSTTNKVDAATLKGKVTITPAVEIDWARVEASRPEPWDRQGAPYVAIPAKFAPGTSYEVTVAPGYQDEFHQAGGGFEATVRLDDLPPKLDLGRELAVLEATRDGALPVVAANIPAADADVWVLSAEELATYLAPAPARRAPPARPATTLPIELSAKKNVEKVSPLPLRKALGEGQSTGLFLVEARAPSLGAEGHPRVLAEVTDLAVHTKLGPKNGVLWVTSLSKGTGVAAARVRLLDEAGATKWEGKTDEGGVARVPGLSELAADTNESGWQTPFMLAVAEKDQDVGATLSSWSDGFQPYAFDMPTDWDGSTPKSLGMVFSERGIYRPGDEVFVKGLVRLRRIGAIETPPADTAVTLVVTDSRDQAVTKRVVKTTSFGSFSAKLTLGREVPLGTYQITTTTQLFGEDLHAGGSFRVEEYRAPKFLVDVTTPKRELVATEPVGGAVLARYLHGGAMSRAQVHYTVSRTSVSFQPPGNPGFSFGIESWFDGRPTTSSDVFASGDGETDAGGALEIAAGKAETPGGKTYEYTIEADVADVNRQHLANRAVVTVHPAALYAGVRAGAGFAEEKKPIAIELVAVDPAGKRQSGAPIAVEIKRREWKSIEKKGVGGDWFTPSEPVDTKVSGCEVKSAEAPATCTFTPDKAGLYVLEATLTDGAGRRSTTKTSVYATGSGWVSWERNDTNRIDLTADKPRYEVGDTAKILVQSPFSDVEALLTVEREGVSVVKRVKLTGSATALEVPIDESMIPNAFVGVILVRGRIKTDAAVTEDPGRPAVRAGYVEVKVDHKDKRLAVKITTDGDKRRPKDHVKLDLEVTDVKGRGKKAELAVWAVDEGVLRLTSYQVPDPIEAVHPTRGLSVRIGEPLIHLVLAKLYGDKGAVPGGSGGNDAAGAGFRSRFKTTPLFQPAVVTSADGKAHVEFDLPDNITTFRVMAFATTEGDLFGTGSTKLVVTKPLLAIPALPRIARVSDHFEAGVVVHADSTITGETKVSLEAKGLSVKGPAERSVRVAAGTPKEVRFAFAAETPGKAVLRFRAVSGPESDGVEETLPVLLPVSMEAVATMGDTESSRAEAITPPGGVRPDVGGLEVTLASTALGNFDEGMRQLVEYPYGCLEQLGSRLVPFVSLRELYGKFQVAYESAAAKAEQKREADLMRSWLGPSTLDLSGVDDPDQVVVRTVKTIEQLQRTDGGYSFWPNGRCSADYASAYAVLALARAREVGYPVDAAGLRRAEAFLADTVAAGRPIDCGFGPVTPGPETRVFALYALARAHAPKPSYYDALFADREKLPLFAQAMLADAMFVGRGDRTKAKQLLTELLNHAKEDPRSVYLEEGSSARDVAFWSSSVRTTAIVLATLADVEPEHPFIGKMTRYLTTARDPGGKFRTTQEAAFALLALSEVVRAKEKASPDFTGKVTLGGTELAVTTFKGRTVNVASKRIAIDELAKQKGQVPLVFAKDGTGVLYYDALLRYAPAELPTKPLDRGLIVERWFEPYGGGGQTREFQAGDLLRVRVRVATPATRPYVAVDVPIPSGLEAVDTTLASTAQSLAARPEGEAESAPASLFAERFYDPFDHVEYRDDRVVLFADRLPPGVHTASFIARATTPGTFVLKPAQAEEMYAPEVFGRSDGGELVVLGTPEVAAR